MKKTLVALVMSALVANASAVNVVPSFVKNHPYKTAGVAAATVAGVAGTTYLVVKDLKNENSLIKKFALSSKEGAKAAAKYLKKHPITTTAAVLVIGLTTAEAIDFAKNGKKAVVITAPKFVANKTKAGFNKFFKKNSVAKTEEKAA